MKSYDVIVIGAGPAGLTSAIYLARYNLNVLVLGKLPGGLAGEAYEVCNFPTQERIPGFKLMKKMLDQVKGEGVEVKAEEVHEISKKDLFEIKTNREVYSAKKIVLAMGSERRKLQLENETKFMGKGISYCATCDSGFYKDKVVAIFGGGNAAVMAADLLSQFGKKIYLIYRGKEFTKAEPAWMNRIKDNKKISFMTESTITKLIGEERLEKIEINEKDILEVDGLFVEIGSVPNVELAKEIGVELDENYIKVDKFQKTNVEGIFAAGDITNNPFKQIITACGEGAVAANSIYTELKK